MSKEWIYREQIVDIGQQLQERGFVAGNDGNISCRLDDGYFLTTPTGMRKSRIKAEELIIANAQGDVIDAPPHVRITSEFLMHLKIYEVRPDISAIVHAHPPTATGFALAHRSLEGNYLPEIIYFMLQPGMAPYGTPGTHKLADAVEATAKKCDAFLMQNHGAVGAGSSLKLAWWNLERLEHLAKIIVSAQASGGPVQLSDDQLNEILALKES